MTTLDDIPSDGLNQIVRRLDLDSVKSLCCISQKYHSNTMIWTTKIADLCGEIITSPNSKQVFFYINHKYSLKFDNKEVEVAGYDRLGSLFTSSDKLMIFTRTLQYPELVVHKHGNQFYYYRDIHQNRGDEVGTSPDTVFFCYLGKYIHLDEISHLKTYTSFKISRIKPRLFSKFNL